MTKKSEDSDDEGMVVVAQLEGHYGKVRKPGEKFVLKSRNDFSKRWMVDPDKDTKRAKELADSFKANGGTSVSEDQIAAELAQSTGKSTAADKKKLARLEQENAELRDRIEKLELELKDVKGTEGEPQGGAKADTKNDDAGNDDSDDDKTDGAPRARRTRVTRG